MTSKQSRETPVALAWAVVNAHAHREEVAIENLIRQGFHCYCPMIRKRLTHARRSSIVRRPLFPGYLFVEVAKEWRPILSTIGVRKLVRFGDEPALLEHAFIETLRAREEDGFIVRPPEPYKVGQRVKLSGGPFDGIVATIVSLQEKDRILVLMELLQQHVRAKVGANHVQPG